MLESHHEVLWELSDQEIVVVGRCAPSGDSIPFKTIRVEEIFDCSCECNNALGKNGLFKSKLTI